MGNCAIRLDKSDKAPSEDEVHEVGDAEDASSIISNVEEQLKFEIVDSPMDEDDELLFPSLIIHGE